MEQAIGIVTNINQSTNEVTVHIIEHPFARFIGKSHTALANEFTLVDLVETEYDCTMKMSFCPFPNRLNLEGVPDVVRESRLKNLVKRLIQV